MSLCELGQNVLAAFCNGQTNGPTILGAAVANDQPRIDETIDELDHGVMTKDKARRELSHRRLGARWQAPHREQELMLTRFDPDLARGRLRERAEPAQLVTKCRQRSVVVIAKRGPRHVAYISPPDISG